MHKRLSLLLRSALYALRGGFLIRPLLIALLLGVALVEIVLGGWLARRVANREVSS